MKNNKAPGPDGIPAEVFKYRGDYLQQHLHSFIFQCLDFQATITTVEGC